MGGSRLACQAAWDIPFSLDRRALLCVEAVQKEHSRFQRDLSR